MKSQAEQNFVRLFVDLLLVVRFLLLLWLLLLLLLVSLLCFILPGTVHSPSSFVFLTLDGLNFSRYKHCRSKKIIQQHIVCSSVCLLTFKNSLCSKVRRVRYDNSFNTGFNRKNILNEQTFMNFRKRKFLFKIQCTRVLTYSCLRMTHY